MPSVEKETLRPVNDEELVTIEGGFSFPDLDPWTQLDDAATFKDEYGDPRPTGGGGTGLQLTAYP